MTTIKSVYQKPDRIEYTLGDVTLDCLKVVILKDGVTIRDIFQDKSLALLSDEIDDIITILNKAKQVIENGELK